MTTTRRIAVTNQKGGVGKTTTAVNLGAGLARLGKRVLICDLDPQCNLTVHVDKDPSGEAPGIYEVLHGKAALADVAQPTGIDGLEVVQASVDLAGVELELAGEVGREVILRHAFERDERERGAVWDFVLIDCPPSLGLLALNALVACDEVFVPIQAEFFALQGLGKLADVVNLVQGRLNPALQITGMVSVRHDPSTNLGRQVMADIRDHFGSVVHDTVIRRNVKLAEAPSYGKTIFEYDPESRGAEDYLALARELLGENTGTPAVTPVAAEKEVEPTPPEQQPAAETDSGPPTASPPAEAASESAA